MAKKTRRSNSQPLSRPAFSAKLLKALAKARLPFRVGGTCAVNIYMGADRATKDLDIFCRPRDYPRILKAAQAAGFHSEIEDERWIAKIRNHREYCDVIFGSANSAAPIADAWFKEIHTAVLWNVRVKLLPPTELIWSKAFIMDRYKFDGNDVAHLILKQHKHIDWRRLMSYMELHWEFLLILVLYFRFVYPSERHCIPDFVLEELLARLRTQMTLPQPQRRICRGRLLSRDDYQIDLDQWGFADLVGDHRWP